MAERREVNKQINKRKHDKTKRNNNFEKKKTKRRTTNNLMLKNTKNHIDTSTIDRVNASVLTLSTPNRDFYIANKSSRNNLR